MASSPDSDNSWVLAGSESLPVETLGPESRRDPEPESAPHTPQSPSKAAAEELAGTLDGEETLFQSGRSGSGPTLPEETEAKGSLEGDACGMEPPGPGDTEAQGDLEETPMVGGLGPDTQDLEDQSPPNSLPSSAKTAWLSEEVHGSSSEDDTDVDVEGLRRRRGREPSTPQPAARPGVEDLAQARGEAAGGELGISLNMWFLGALVLLGLGILLFSGGLSDSESGPVEEADLQVFPDTGSDTEILEAVGDGQDGLKQQLQASAPPDSVPSLQNMALLLDRLAKENQDIRLLQAQLQAQKEELQSLMHQPKGLEEENARLRGALEQGEASQRALESELQQLRAQLQGLEADCVPGTDGVCLYWGRGPQAGKVTKEHRYMAIPSPLVAVEWWRICLDEAQMVECPAVKAAEMAQRLSGINRWCISGTPVQRGLEDLFGLVVFLGIEPYCVKHWWVRLLYRPYCKKNPQPLYSFIAKILWRSAKKDVIDQIQIPPQTEEIHWLHFSPVERHFYHRQHEVCCQDAVVKLRKISDWALKLSSLDRRTVTSILYPLLRLRQACCHPQAVRGEFLPLQKSTMTMEELLTSLQKKCGTECEEAHRQLVCALNGLAGIHIIKGEYALAAELYREVLRSSEEHKEKLKTDSLQRLHATHNLMELLMAKHPGIPPTLRDGRLEEEARQLREHYMSKCNTEVAEAQQALLPVQQTIRDLQRKIYSNSPWWLNVIHRAIEFGIEEELVQRVRNEITSNYKQQTGKLSMSEKFHDCRGLQFLLTTQMEELSKFQKQVREAVKNLEGPPSRHVIESATICHLRPARLPLNCCVFCKADELFTEYESKLFSHTVKGQTAIFEEMIEDEEGLVDDRIPTTSRGLWAVSETERSMKALLSFAKSHRFDIEFIDEGSTSMDLFEAWKKEYKLLHEYWMALRNRVSAVDELAMATERLRVRDPREPKPNPPVLHIIEPHEVEQNRIKLLNDKAVATSQLQKKLGQLLYLTNLEKSQDKTSGGVNPEPCPICARQLGKQWAVLTCGHCFCNECISIIIEQYSVGSHRSSIKCAICRQTTSHKEISYVFTSEKASQEEDIPVKGSHSTKVEAVVRTLMRIQLRDPGAKALVFSTWQDVLDIISKALTDNNMEFAQISRVKTFQENLSAFKHDPQINILLLPLHTGSNGLTIIEATHVLLVEPILNPAHELQAIGRVHRIGQTKPTIVHRFLIKATIEERMQAMLKTAERSHTNPSAKHSEASVLTVADLADLFTKETEDLE